MAHDNVWVFVDDKADEAVSFAEELSRTGLISVEVLGPAEARIQLLQQRRHPAGVLMDVDLSAIVSEFGTGPGIAQDIRTKQKAGLACEFPIVRFSAMDPLVRNVFGDPSSEDLFELKVLKDDVPENRDQIISQLRGTTAVYEVIIHLVEQPDKSEEILAQLFGENAGTLVKWSHEGLTAKVLTGSSHAPHVAAGAFCRQFLVPPGLLIDERLLAVRLGIDTIRSGAAWHEIAGKCQFFAYKGVAGQHFPRWWSRGLDEWWFTEIDNGGPIAGRTPTERVELLSRATGVTGLVALGDSVRQSEFRPWRFCRLGIEASPPQYIPVDPAESVRVTPQADFPPWVEPYSASAKLAFRARGDQRLNKKDLERLRKKYKV